MRNTKRERHATVGRLLSFLLPLAMMIYVVTSLPTVARADTPVTSVASLAELVAAYDQDGDGTIDLNGNTVSVTARITINGSYTFTNGTLKRASSLTDYLILNGTKNATLTLENITLDGNSQEVTAAALVYLNRDTASLIMNSGAVLQNSKSVASEYAGGSAVYVCKGTFTMNGGVITGCEAGLDGTVFVEAKQGKFIMNGGEIKNNAATRNGGGVYMNGNYANTFTMNGGRIFGNTAGGSGGSVYVGGSSNIVTFGGAAETEISGSIYLPAGKTLSVTPADEYIVVVDNTVQTPVDGTVTISSVAANLLIKKPDLSIAAKPNITEQPSGANYVTGDQAAPLSVTAGVTDGGVLSYQWYSNTTNSPTGASAIDGATAAAYTPGTEASGTTYYYCVVTNSLAGAIANTAASDIAAVTVVAVKQTCDTIYLDGVNGNDANIGTAAQDAVKTFGEAKKWLNSDGTIYLCGQVTVADEQTWSLAGLGSAKVARYDDFKGTSSNPVNIALVAGGGRLTLENITIDGVGIDAETAGSLHMDEIAKVASGGTLVMNGGATLANAPNVGVSVGGGDFVMNGGLITGGYGTAVANWGGGDFTMNGGEISGNQDTGVALASSDYGSFTMTGGIITNNISSSHSNNLYVSRGTVVITGGTISDGDVSNGMPGVSLFDADSFTIAPAAGKTVVTDTIFRLYNASSSTPVFTVGAPLTDDLVISVYSPANGYKLVQGTGAYALTSADAARISVAHDGYRASWDAAGNAVNLLQSGLAVIAVGSAEGTQGGAVTVPVTIAGNPGFCAFAFSLNFDTEKLELTGITNGSVVGALTATNTTTLPYGLSFVSPSDVTTASGALFNLHFTVKEGFAGGACPVSVYCKDNDPDNFCNENLDTVPVNFVSGVITVAGSGESTPPVLIADTTGVTVGQAVYLTFSDDETWRGAITGITVNTAPLPGEQYTVNPGGINLAANVFGAPGDYSIAVAATGYSDATVTQTIYGAAPDYTVTFVSDGATYTTVSAAVGTAVEAPAEPVKDGHVFGGWYTDEAWTTAVAFPYTVTGDVILYAKWTDVPADNPKYTVTPVEDAAVYEVGETGGISTMTVKTGVSGLKYFGALIEPVVGHEGHEAVVFTHLRGGVQLSLNVTRADFDLIGQAQAGFNVQAGDVVKVFIVDDLTNDVNHNPILLQ